MLIPNFLSHTERTTVQINGIYVPFNKSIETLQRFCRPVIFHNEDPVYEASLSGSAFLLQHNGKNFFICTRHQLGEGKTERSPEDIIIVVYDDDNRKQGLTSNEAIKTNFSDQNTKSLEDILLLRFEGKRGYHDLDRYFVNLNLDASPNFRAISDAKIVAIFTIGYPTQSLSYDPELDDEYVPIGLDIRVRWSKLYLERTGETAFDCIPNRLPLKVHSKYTININDLDGYSGAPVFFLYKDDHQLVHLGLVGMITHANREGRFAIYEAIYIKEILNRLNFKDSSSPD